MSTVSRRMALKAAAISASGLGCTLANASPADFSVNGSGKNGLPKIRITGYRYDRVEPLLDGRVSPDGFDADFQVSKIGDMNTHVFSGPGEIEVTEIGLTPFILAYANEGFRDYVLIPVFPLRTFRHRSIFIRKDRGIHRPQDLVGRKVAAPGYSTTSLTWIRGILQDEYGVKPSDIKWVIASKDSSSADSGARSKQESVLPQDLTFIDGPAGKNESEMLADGDVDAIFHAAEPKAYLDGHPNVGRLFEDYREVERGYYASTAIYPAMHSVAIRRGAIAEHPSLPVEVFKAYSLARKMNQQYMQKAGWYVNAMPWFAQEFSETKALMGEDYYSYGFERNRKVIDTLLRYTYEQGLCSRRLSVEEMFDPSTLKLEDAS